MKFTIGTITAMACVLAASMAFAQTPPTTKPVEKAKAVHQQKAEHLLRPGQKAALEEKTAIVMKAMAAKNNKRGVAKLAHSAKINAYTKQQPVAKSQAQPNVVCKNGICSLSHDPAAKK